MVPMPGDGVQSTVMRAVPDKDGDGESMVLPPSRGARTRGSIPASTRSVSPKGDGGDSMVLPPRRQAAATSRMKSQRPSARQAAAASAQPVQHQHVSISRDDHADSAAAFGGGDAAGANDDDAFTMVGLRQHAVGNTARYAGGGRMNCDGRWRTQSCMSSYSNQLLETVDVVARSSCASRTL